MAKLRIYLVKHGKTERLVEAGSKYAALSYVVKTALSVDLASQADLVRLVQDGAMVETIIDEAGDKHAA